MSDAKVITTGGVLTIGATSAAPTSLYAGTLSKSTTLQRRVNTISDQALEQDYPMEDVISTQYELSAEVFLPLAGTSGLLGIANTEAYAVYKVSGVTTAFAGKVLIGDISETESRNSYHLQSISMRSTGKPDVG